MKGTTLVLSAALPLLALRPGIGASVAAPAAGGEDAVRQLPDEIAAEAPKHKAEEPPGIMVAGDFGTD